VATDRLFFALRPDAAAAARMHQLTLRLRDVHQLTGKPLAVERLHVTLGFLGDHDGLPPRLVAAADAVARGVLAEPFELAFDHVMSFERNQGAAPLVLCRETPCAPLDALCTQLGTDTTRDFKPHATLLYDSRAVPLHEVDAISWTVTEVLLIRSLVGRARHEVLGRYPLG
jgi:2'-5' RNA ligase